MMNNCAARIGNSPGNFVAVRRPIGRFGEVKFTAYALVVCDDKIAVLVDPSLAAKQVVNASSYLVPAIVIVVTWQSDIDSS